MEWKTNDLISYSVLLGILAFQSYEVIHVNYLPIPEVHLSRFLKEEILILCFYP